MTLAVRPIGVVRTAAIELPRHCSISDVEGTLVVDEALLEGLADVEPGQLLAVVFWFHESPPFSAEHLRQRPPTTGELRGVFSTCSPIRPNPLGHSVVEVVAVRDNEIAVRGLDMRDGTPILDLKPHKEARPSDVDGKGRT
ncbi:MAG: SAM-dependent methyltransferase [Deltaproteobacteria bacterium]|jgi:tRNA-Thr(GGU) m(6)t(6)A37 methyltransferase TsaA|nr:SAM-dependent methyltransferase [Deltaproteobacteria bacterium]MBW2530592.1 SAM-dependent methyltransferase [Deltaproteobacteria bacterium]